MSGNRQRFTLAYLRAEAAGFRAIMCDRTNCIEKIDKAFEGVFYVYLQGTATGDGSRKMADDEIESADYLIDAITEEWVRRKALMMFAGHPITKEDAELLLDATP